MNEDQTLGIHCIIGGLILFVIVCVIEWLGGKPQRWSVAGMLGIIGSSVFVGAGIFFWGCCTVFAAIDKFFLN